MVCGVFPVLEETATAVDSREIPRNSSMDIRSKKRKSYFCLLRFVYSLVYCLLFLWVKFVKILFPNAPEFR